MKNHRFVTVAVAALWWGCSSDAAVAPTPPLDLNGTWFYTANSLASSVFGEPVDCTYEFEMDLVVTGASFEGIYEGAQMFCTLFGAPQLVDAGGGDITNGSLVGNAVSFDVDSDNVRNVGTLSPMGLNGNVTISLVVQHNSMIDTIEVIGPWSARR